MARLDLSNRDAALKALEAETFDLLVIGGGITGAGIARDAALRGLRVALVEARDFASGTSSKSTKLVHGGLRYLAQGDIGLVREAARERAILRNIAPHLVRRTLLILPARTRLDLLTRSAALFAFDRLGNVERGDRFETWDRRALKVAEPCLKSEGLAGAVVYPEFLTDDARLVIANVRSAVTAGAVAVNYVGVKEFVFDGGAVCGVVLSETLGASTRSAQVKARLVINAAGPWADDVRRLASASAQPKVTLTQGIHLVFRAGQLPLSHMALVSAADGRGIFAIPRGAFTYVGTTDIAYPQAAYWPNIAQDQIDYLLSAINQAFDISPLRQEHVVSMWSGLRPLIAQPGKGPSEISRKDEIFEEAGLITIAGGKLTTYRSMAEKVVDLALTRLGRAHVKSTTAESGLRGSEPVSLAKLITEGVTDLAVERLARLYGSEAYQIAEAGGDVAAEARHAVLNEGAVTLEDFWFRRSARAWFPAGDSELARKKEAAAAMASLLGWSESDTARQIADCQALEARSFLAGHSK